MTLTDDDRLWRDQNIPSVSDEELDKIIDTFGSNGEAKTDKSAIGNGKDNNNDPKEIDLTIPPKDYEEWTTKLLEKRNNLKDIIKDNIPQLWLSIQLITSVKCILNIADCTLPLIMILLGAASSNKTVPIEMLRDFPNTFYTDSFSAKAMVSHSTAVKKQDLPDIDMLPKIKDKTNCQTNSNNKHNVVSIHLWDHLLHIHSIARF
ncbi:MAG: hypothetical protein M3O68_03065 [Thermoproteota archaeon]|nr:hypothetical protein [Thermoproteota archaeon]